MEWTKTQAGWTGLLDGYRVEVIDGLRGWNAYVDGVLVARAFARRHADADEVLRRALVWADSEVRRRAA